MQANFIGQLQELIAFVIAYVPVVTLGGYFQARIANAVGDSSPRQYGFMTLDPLQHIHFLGMAMLSLFHFGFGKAQPMEVEGVTSPYRSLKQMVLFQAGAIAYFMVLLLSFMLAALVTFFIIMAVPGIAVSPDICPAYLSSFLLITGAMVKLSLLLFEINFFIGIATAFVFFCLPRFYEEFLQSRLLIFVLTLLLLLIYGEHMRLLVAYVVSGFMYAFHSLLGLIS